MFLLLEPRTTTLFKLEAIVFPVPMTNTDVELSEIKFESPIIVASTSAPIVLFEPWIVVVTELLMFPFNIGVVITGSKYGPELPKSSAVNPDTITFGPFFNGLLTGTCKNGSFKENYSTFINLLSIGEYPSTLFIRQ